MTVPVNGPIGKGGYPGAINPNAVVTSISPLFTDHSDLVPFNQAAASTAFQSAGARQTAAQMFWSTESRPASSKIQETLEISLTSERLVNTLQFDMAVFPHTLDIQYYDSGAKNWVPLVDRRHGSLRQWIMRSIPTQLPNPTNVPGHLHPQHSFLAHWRTVELQTLPTYMQRLRFVLQRYDNGLGPVGPLNTKVDYSLALRNISLGYEVVGRQDIPRALPVDNTYDESFASTDDLLGSSLAFALRDPTVDRISGNTDTNADAIWVCEPQPYPGAVVCFYADLRDSKNNPQVIDQIFLNPVTSGAHVTVYYSNDLYTQASFDSPTYALSTTQVSQTGTVKLEDQRLQFGTYGQQAALSIPNVPLDSDTPAQRNKAALGYDPTTPWWFGVIARAGFDQGVDVVEHPIIDCGQWRLSLTIDGLTLTLNGYDPRVCPIIYQAGEDITAIVSYDGQGEFHVHATTTYGEADLDFWANAFPPGECPTISLGADLDGQYFGNCDLLGLVLKDELADGSDDFLVEPYSYCSVAEFAVDDLPQSHSALLRLDVNTKRVNADHPWALFGGPAVKYESLSWTPVPRDYVMARGWMHLPPTRARYVKLEITNLQAIPHEIAVQGPQQVKTFPPDVLAHYGQRLVNASSQTVPFGIDTQISLTGHSAYADVPIFISTGGNGDRGYTNTEVYIADDYSTGQRLRAIQNENWGYQTYHVGNDAPRFPTVCVHRYTEETVTRTGKVAYQCGLRQVIFATSSFTTQQDTALYDDPLYTTNNLVTDSDLTNMIYDPETSALTSGDSDETHASSLIYTSLRDVRAVQFAVQQTPAAQLLPDDEFADPTFSNWSMVGDVVPPIEGVVISPVFGSLLPVSRALQLGYWGDIEPVFQTYGGITTLGYTWGDLRKKSSAKTGETFGGVASNPVPQPNGGRIYAATRVVSDIDLSSPLHLQIVDAITQLPLADESATVKADQVTEWYTGYTIGEGAETSGNTWGDVDGAYLGDYESYSDSFAHPDATSLGLMDSGQQWTSPTTSAGSLAQINNVAVCNLAGQVSAVDTKTPWGTLSVLLGTAVTTGTASASVPLLYLGHMRLMNDGRVLDVNTGRVMATVAGIATNDSLQVDFLPTSMLTAADWGGTWPATVDATVQAWAFVIHRNGTRIVTVATTRAFGTMRGIAGAVGQQFQSFGWVPRQAGVPAGQVIPAQPMPTDGSQDPSGTIWTQASGQQWNTLQNPQQSPPVPPIFTANPAWQGGNTITGPSFPAGDQSPQPPSVTLVSTNVPQSTGTFSFRVNQLVTITDPDTPIPPVALLDTGSLGSPLQLLANGDLVKSVAGAQVTLKAAVIPSASMTTGDIAIKYVSASTLSAAFKTTWAIPSTVQQVMIFLVNNVVTGVFFGADTDVVPLPVAGSSDVPSLVGPTKALYNKLPVPLPDPTKSYGMQSFQIDSVNQRMYTLQSYDGPNGHLYLSWLDMAHGGARQSQFMTLKGFGHGQQFGIEITGGTTYIWLECDGVNTGPGTNAFGTKICRFAWAPGTTLTSSTGAGMTKYNLQPNSTGNGVMIDGGRLLLQYNNHAGTQYLATYNVADVKALGNSAVPITPPIKPAAHSGTMQGRGFYGDNCYSIAGDTRLLGDPATPACGPLQPVTLYWQNVFTGKSGSSVTSAGVDLPRREPEGISIQVIGGQGRLVWSFATKADCTGVGDSLQSFFYNYLPAPPVWASTTRGLYTYNDNAGHATITTGFSWSTDANGVSTGGTGQVLWGDVSQMDTRLWGDLTINVSATNLNPVYVQLIQQAASTDSWYVDTLSLFSDPIVWEFSNDGGKTWVPGFEVANDPQAVIAFNPRNPDDLTTKANLLCYRVTCWAPDQWISHLAIRPWYLGFMRGVPTRPQGSIQGPNLNPWDHYPPIEADPRWQLWSLPIPREWWFAFRTPDATPRFTTPFVTDNVLIR